MKQSSFIVGALLAAFVLFIAARGRLPLYASVLWGPKPIPQETQQTPQSDRGSGFGGFELPDLPDLGDIFDDFDLGDIAKVIPFVI